MAKKRQKTTKKGMSWGQIGAAIGSKLEKESGKSNAQTPFTCWTWHQESKRGGHFFAALVFAITALWALGQMGYSTDVLPWWIKALLVLTFAIMFS